MKKGLNFKKPIEKVESSSDSSSLKNSREKENSSSENSLIDLRRRKRDTNAPSADGVNFKIVSLIEKLITQISNENKSETDPATKKKNQWRLVSLRKAYDILKTYPEEITSGKQALEIDGIGKGISERIDEILKTGTLSELKAGMGETEESLAVQSLMTVHDIGEVHALDFYRKYHVRSAEELISLWRSGGIAIGKHQLTHKMAIGLKYYHDFLKKIPRDEIDEFNQQLKRIFTSIDSDLGSGKLSYEICGSYRRQKAFSGDIDILFSHSSIRDKDDLERNLINHEKDPKKHPNYLKMVVDKLIDAGYIIDSLDTNINKYYKGVAKIRESARRIDIMIIPLWSFPTAVLHATGSGDFNQDIRMHAMKKGYTLSQHGLFKIGSDGKPEEEPIKVNSEEEVFTILGLKYIQPIDRI